MWEKVFLALILSISNPKLLHPVQLEELVACYHSGLFSANDFGVGTPDTDGNYATVFSIVCFDHRHPLAARDSDVVL